MNFNNTLIRQLSSIASCNRIEGIVIDESELASLADVIREASRPKTEMNVKSSLADALPITRASLNVLAGDENDLLAEFPVYKKGPARVADEGGFPK